MDNNNLRSNNISIILIIIAIGIFICAFFLYDNYSDKQKLKESIESKLESEREATSEEYNAKNEEMDRLSRKNLELLKSGQVYKGRFNPKLHQWVFNNRSNEACLIISEKELNQYSGIYYTVKGICTESAVEMNLGDVYTRYANQKEIDLTINSVK